LECIHPISGRDQSQIGVVENRAEILLKMAKRLSKVAVG